MNTLRRKKEASIETIRLRLIKLNLLVGDSDNSLKTLIKKYLQWCTVTNN